MSRFSLETIFQGRDQISATMSKIRMRAAAMSAGVGESVKQLDSGFGKVHERLKGLALGSGVAGAAIGTGLYQGLKVGADFEHVLASLNAVAKPTGSELSRLSDTALKVASSFGFTGVDVAKSMEAMSKQGLSVQEVLAGIGGVAAAAAADGSTMDETMGGLLATMAGMGMGAGSLQHIGDVMAKAGDATAASIGSLAESMSVFGPTARALGIGIEDAVGQLAILQDAGIDASSAGTTLSAVYSKLAAPAADTTKALEKLGLSISDQAGNLKAPQVLMAEIFKATSGIQGNVGQMAAFTDLVGLNSQKALLNISAAAGSGKLDKVLGSLKEGVDGYATSVASLKTDSTIGSTNKLVASFESLRIAVFGLVSKDFRDLVDKATAWVSANKEVIASGILEFVKDFKAAIPEIVTWMERIGKALVVFYAFKAAVGAVNLAMTAMNVILAANPLTLWVVGVMAAIALIWAFWPEISAFFSQLWTGITDLASSVATSIGNFFSGLWNSAKPYLWGFVEFMVGIFTVLTLPSQLLWKGILALAGFAFEGLKILWTPISAFFSMIWGGITSLASAAWNGIVSFASSAVAKVKEIWAPIGEFFSGLWEGIKSGFASAMDWIRGKLDWLLRIGGGIIDFFQGVGRDQMDGNSANDLSSEVISQGERLTHSLTETRSSGELLIRDQTGRAEITKPMTGLMSLNLAPTGAF